jgi:hypothetical protein
VTPAKSKIYLSAPSSHPFPPLMAAATFTFRLRAICLSSFSLCLFWASRASSPPNPQIWISATSKCGSLVSGLVVGINGEREEGKGKVEGRKVGEEGGRRELGHTLSRKSCRRP